MKYTILETNHGHTPGVLIPSFSISFYFLLDFQILVLDLSKPPLIFGFNQLICDNLF